VFTYRFPVIKKNFRCDYLKKLHSNKDKKIKLTVEMYNPAPQNQYYLLRLLERQFKETYLNFVAGFAIAGIPAKQAIRCFYVLYGLTDADWSFDTSYKTWQRSPQKKMLDDTTKSKIREFLDPAAWVINKEPQLWVA
jgi:hypothetical protein